MRVLVTGGAGFIGSHVVDRLIAAGHQVRILDLVHSQYHSGDAVEQIVGDLLDPETVRRAVAGTDAVMHLAAVADVDKVTLDPATADAVNVRGTQTLLDCVREHGTKRFVFASTIWVYGDASDPTPVEETAPVALPKHFYTATKLAGEMYTASYGALYGVEWTILRFGIPYGPRARPTAVVPALTARALAGQTLTIAGDGTQVRRFVYVEDLAEGCVAALAPIAANRIYNLVGDETTSVRAIARSIRDIVGMVPIEHIDGRVGDLHGGNVSGRRAAHELGWRVTTSFVDGVQRYVDWVTADGGTPSAAIADSTDGSADTVARQDSGAP
ncbi:MAG TPA: NAD-dependent epimerase/dehydratase family protein [Gaiellaceae bacterium]|nr:NAD-dependent epimerase/dehydratase family protein [Gaiellaceae bacterium]